MMPMQELLSEPFLRACRVLELWFKSYYIGESIAEESIDQIRNACEEFYARGYVEPVQAGPLYRALLVEVHAHDLSGYANVGAFVLGLDQKAHERKLRLSSRAVASFTPFPLASAIYATHNLKANVHGDENRLHVGSVAVIIEVPVSQLTILISMRGLMDFVEAHGSFNIREIWKLKTVLRALRFRFTTRPLRSAFWNYSWSNEVVCFVKKRALWPQRVLSVPVEYCNFHSQRLIEMDPRIQRKSANLSIQRTR